MRFKGLLLSLLLTTSQVIAGDKIPYEVIDKSELGTIKMSFDVQIPLVDNRLPNSEEIGAISKYLVNTSSWHERTFVSFYLPGMKVGSGAFATAHHNPDMEVNIMPIILMQYPEYSKFVE
jgi:hypothetical protein